MRKLTMIFLLALTCHLTQAQAISEVTKAEQFGLKSGVLIEKEFIPVGKFKSIELQVIKFTDINTKISQSALRFELEVKGSYSISRKVSSIDIEEIQDLKKAIQSIQSHIFPSQRAHYTEVIFVSKTGFEAGAYYNVEKKKWSAYIQIEKHDKDSLVFLSPEDFSTLLDLLAQAENKLN